MRVLSNILADWSNQLNTLRGILISTVYSNLSLCISSMGFCVTQSFFMQKTNIFIHYYSLSIWDIEWGI